MRAKWFLVPFAVAVVTAIAGRDRIRSGFDRRVGAGCGGRAGGPRCGPPVRRERDVDADRRR